MLHILTWQNVHAAVAAERQDDAPPSDERLVRATLGGEDHAFAELIRRHKGRVFGTCSRFARGAHQLDDLCQEVFLRAYRKLSSFRGDAPFEHWLATLTVSACLDFVRRERRHRDQLSLDEVELPIRDTSIESAAAAGRAKELITWSMAQLDAEDRMVLTLLELEERSIRDIAALTGWGESKVKVRAFRARAKLKEIIQASHEA